YLRAKIGRRLQRLGAVALKNSVYVLPQSEQTREDFQWVAREIVEGGGDATVCDTRFVEGATDGSIEALFLAARDSDYAQLGEEARAILETLPLRRPLTEELRVEARTRLQRLERRLGEVTAIDFLGAPGREGAESLLASARGRLVPDG